MAGPVQKRGGGHAAAEAREMAELLLKLDHDRNGLDRAELSFDHFSEVAGDGCEDARIGASDLERAFLRLAPAERAALAADLRRLVAEALHHQFRIALPLIGGVMGVPVSAFALNVSMPAGLLVSAFCAGCLVNGIRHWVAYAQANAALAARLDEALC